MVFIKIIADEMLICSFIEVVYAPIFPIDKYDNFLGAGVFQIHVNNDALSEFIFEHRIFPVVGTRRAEYDSFERVHFLTLEKGIFNS